ncbi:MAG: glycosyltransferase family 4 protein [Patescibacteria group bacterium]
MKKIIFLSTRINAGYFGTEKFLDNLLGFLKNDFECEFIGYDRPIFDVFEKHNLKAKKQSGGFEPDGIKKRIFSPISFVLGLIKIFSNFNSFKGADLIVFPADIIGESVFTGFWLKLIFNKKFISIIHKNDCEESIYKNPFLKIYKHVMKNGIQVFVSESQRKRWLDKKATTQYTKVIHNGVEITTFNPLQKPLSGTEVKIGYIGRIHNDKNLLLLAEALKDLNTTTKLVVNLAGEGEDYQEIKAKFDEVINPNININWLGFLKNVNEFFDENDFLVYPSKREGFALVTLEAYQRGMTVLTSDIEPFLECKKFMDDKMVNKNLHFKVNDKISLQNSLLLLIQNPQEFQEPLKLHDFVKSNFSLNKMSLEYINLINELIL